MLLLPALLFLVTEPLDLEAHAWSERVLLIFAPSKGHPMIEAQRQEFEGTSPALVTGGAHAEAFLERDLVLYLVTPKYILREDASGHALLPPDPALPGRFHTPDDYTTILLGKDTDEKLRRVGQVLTRKALLSRIDAMPMRRAEMRSH